MSEIRKAKRNPTPGVTHYYVPSDSDPEVEYMVVEIEGNGSITRFCQCDDFFGRKIALLGTDGCHCRHIVKVLCFKDKEGSK